MLGTFGIVAQSYFAAGDEPLQRPINFYLQIVMREGKSLAIQGKQPRRKKKKAAINKYAEKLHPVDRFEFCLVPALARRCLAISYSTTPAATETLSDGTEPSIGMETRKSQFLRTCSCRPLPSAPRTSAQSML